MSKSNSFENSLLQLLFNNVDIANIGDAAGIQNSAVAGSLYVALHTADPGEAGDQTTSECAYGSYDRVAVARTVGGWTVVTDTASNTALAQFPECTSGSETITYVSIGTSAYPTAGVILYSGALTSSRSVSTGIQPQFAALGLSVTES
jgi:hypothetical protein